MANLPYFDTPNCVKFSFNAIVIILNIFTSLFLNAVLFKNSRKKDYSKNGNHEISLDNLHYL